MQTAQLLPATKGNPSDIQEYLSRSFLFLFFAFSAEYELHQTLTNKLNKLAKVQLHNPSGSKSLQEEGTFESLNKQPTFMIEKHS